MLVHILEARLLFTYLITTLLRRTEVRKLTLRIDCRRECQTLRTTQNIIQTETKVKRMNLVMKSAQATVTFKWVEGLPLLYNPNIVSP